MTDTNTGYCNTGNRNTGCCNTGYCNTGNRNTGNRNTGNRNTGNRNTGCCNTGDWNTGYTNTGNSNTGDRNTGNSNTGYWNTCDYETGFFNTEQSGNIRVFNKECDRQVWLDADKPDFMYFSLTEWIDESAMSDQEKIDHETFHTTGGYLKSYKYQEAFQTAWKGASEEDRETFKQLPNFDAGVFFEISGIDVGEEVSTNPKEIVIDGATYVLREE